ncbi:MAG: response regulator transcription factor [Polyangiaceae bacterium]
MPRVLVVDDDAKLRDLVREYLEEHGLSVECVGSGEVALQRLQGSNFDCALVDMMMPGIDGLEVIRRLRQRGDRIPVIMLTAKGDETDRVVGLEVGADDYVAKPFGPRELVARIKAVVRRSQPDSTKSTLRAGTLTLDVEAREVLDGDVRIDLTGVEFDILHALVRRAGRVIRREQLLAEAGRGDVAVSDRVVDVHVSKLRQKLGERHAARIKTVRGLGYVFAKAADAGESKGGEP